MQDIRTNIDDWIAAALAGDLSPEEQTAFDRHLQENGESRALFEETKAMSTAIEETLKTDRPGPGFEARMISGFREKARKPRVPLTSLIARWIRLPLVYIPATAVVLIGMVIIGERVTNEPSPKVQVFSATDQLKKESESGAVDSADGKALPTAAAALSGNDNAGNGSAGSSANETTIVGIPPGSLVSNGAVTPTAPVPTDQNAATITPPTDSNSADLQARIGGTKLRSTTTTVGFSVDDSQAAPSMLTGVPMVGQPFNTASIQSGKAFGGAEKQRFGSSTYSVTVDATDKLALNAPANAAYRGSVTAITGNSGAPRPSDAPAASQLSVPSIPDARKLIRNASVDLEVKNYDEAMDAIDAIARGSGGYVDTRNSYRLPNGKEAGTVVIKIPPNALDGSLLRLRSIGELRNQNLSTEDVTSQYYDIDARLRNAQKMEDRLLDLLATVKGRVSDLLQVEQTLGRVREHIEEMQGQLKLYDSLVQYATITISLHEKDLNQPAAYLLTENVSLSLFAPDVEKAYTSARREAQAANAQIVQSQLTQQESGGMSAVMRLVIDPDRADALIDSIRGLGRVQDFAKHEERIARDGSGNSAAAKEDRDKVTLDLTIMPAEEQPVQFTDVAVQSSSVEQQTARIRQEAAGFDLKGSNFERTVDGSEAANMIFRLPLEKYSAFLAQIQDLGEVKGLTVRRQDQNGGNAANAVAEVSLRIYSQPAIVADDSGLFATLRRTLGEAFGGLMWSVRMIGVAVAFLVPWALALAALVWIVRRILRRKSGKKQEP